MKNILEKKATQNKNGVPCVVTYTYDYIEERVSVVHLGDRNHDKKCFFCGKFADEKTDLFEINYPGVVESQFFHPLCIGKKERREVHWYISFCEQMFNTSPRDGGSAGGNYGKYYTIQGRGLDSLPTIRQIKNSATLFEIRGHREYISKTPFDEEVIENLKKEVQKYFVSGDRIYVSENYKSQIYSSSSKILWSYVAN
jgi:hypothetical protein